MIRYKVLKTSDSQKPKSKADEWMKWYDLMTSRLSERYAWRANHSYSQGVSTDREPPSLPTATARSTEDTPRAEVWTTAYRMFDEMRESDSRPPSSSSL